MATELWIEQLKKTVEEYGASEVSRRLGCSPTTVSLIASGKYPSPVDKWKARYLAEFAPGEVDCPVLGEISRRACGKHRKRPFAATNPTRVALFRACRTCIHNPDRVEEDADEHDL